LTQLISKSTTLLQAIDSAISFVSADASNAPINPSGYNIDEDELTRLNLDQTAQFKKDGFCVLDDSLNSQIALIVRGYVKRSYSFDAQFEDGVISLLIDFYHSRFNERRLVQFTLAGHSESQSLLIPRRCVQLSSVMCESAPMSAAAIVLGDDEKDADEKDKKLAWAPMQHVFRYLVHHNGEEPEPLPCPVRSIHMSQICSDKWDADFIDVFPKKEVFEIILCANALGLKSLLHLGCAKAVTLIKQLDQKEINRIIEEEERYRREQKVNASNEQEEEEVLEIEQVPLKDDDDESADL